MSKTAHAPNLARTALFISLFAILLAGAVHSEVWLECRGSTDLCSQFNTYSSSCTSNPHSSIAGAFYCSYSTVSRECYARMPSQTSNALHDCNIFNDNPDCYLWTGRGCTAMLSQSGCDPVQPQATPDYGHCSGTYNACDKADPRIFNGNHYDTYLQICGYCGWDCTVVSQQGYPDKCGNADTSGYYVPNQNPPNPNGCSKFDGHQAQCTARARWGCNWVPTAPPCLSVAGQTLLPNQECCQNIGLTQCNNKCGFSAQHACTVSAQAECCSGVCDASRTQCCIPEGAGSCAADADCCGPSGSLVCGSAHICEVPNLPPTTPGAPVISPLSVALNGTVDSIQSLDPYPYDQDNNPPGVSLKIMYAWSINGNIVLDWYGTGPHAPPETFDCLNSIQHCQVGDKITLMARACDGLAACSFSPPSLPAVVRCSLADEYCSVTSHCCAQSPALTCDQAANRCIYPPPPPITGQIDWRYFIFAFVAVIAILALAYMASYAFSLPSLRAIVQDELVQVLATLAIAFMLVGLQTLADTNLSAMSSISTGIPGQSVSDAAYTVLNTQSANASNLLDNFLQSSVDIGREASRGIFCNFMGVGMSLVSCSQLNAFRGSLTLATITTSTALADIYAQKYLLSFATSYAFKFIIPLGLFLRCFKIGRGAGGALIAIGFGFYSVYPVVMVATDRMLHGASPPDSGQNLYAFMPSLGNEACDPSETSVQASLDQFNEYSDKLTSFDGNLSIAYLVLVRIIFMSVLNLIITLGFIRAFAHILGSEIDVSGLARIS